MAQAASEAKDRFIATVSHELRGPLAPIANLLEVLKVSDEIPPSSRPLLDMIERNLWQEARLVDDLLQTSRITSHKLTLDPRDVELHPLLREIAAGLEADFRNADVELVLALEAGSDRLRADLRRLRQLFLNLLTNAKKFTPAGGRVEIRTTNPRPGQVQIGVCDTGAGLEPDQIERVFQPFEQTAIGRFGGLGLGLPIARGFAEAHGGTLEAQSEGHDKGTTFIVTLPIAGPGG
jgi:signal transduction histidine kinase